MMIGEGGLMFVICVAIRDIFVVLKFKNCCVTRFEFELFYCGAVSKTGGDVRLRGRLKSVGLSGR